MEAAWIDARVPPRGRARQHGLLCRANIRNARDHARAQDRIDKESVHDEATSARRGACRGTWAGNLCARHGSARFRQFRPHASKAGDQSDEGPSHNDGTFGCGVDHAIDRHLSRSLPPLRATRRTRLNVVAWSGAAAMAAAATRASDDPSPSCFGPQGWTYATASPDTVQRARLRALGRTRRGYRTAPAIEQSTTRQSDWGLLDVGADNGGSCEGIGTWAVDRDDKSRVERDPDATSTNRG